MVRFGVKMQVGKDVWHTMYLEILPLLRINHGKSSREAKAATSFPVRSPEVTLVIQYGPNSRFRPFNDLDSQGTLSRSTQHVH